jgi:uncharacterized protein YdeI (YjbR/CyaY-like superfamily)
MGQKDKRVDAYIAKSAEFARPILKQLRGVVHKGCPGVEETLKWGFPHFQYHGILCSMAAFKEHCAFGFWKASIMTDPEKRLTTMGKTAMGHFGRIQDLSDLPPEKTILAYVKEAARLNEEGVKVPVKRKPAPKTELVVPDYVVAALKRNKKASKSFEGFSYSHKKEYLEWITEARTEETRNKRLATAIEWMAEGKSRNWKYQR